MNDLAGVEAPDAVPAAQTARRITSLSPNQRAWRRFRRNRIGFVSMIIFAAMLVVATFAELVSNDKPLLARYQGEWFVPVISNPPETRFGGDFKSPTDWHDPFIRQQFAKPGNFALFTINDYAGNTVNYFDKVPAPAPPNRENWFGTDEAGRDMMLAAGKGSDRKSVV